MLEDRVFITGLGVISAIGNSLKENWTSLQAGQSGIGPITLFHSAHNLPVGEVKLSNEDLSRQSADGAPSSRTSLLGVIAAREAMNHSAIDFSRWRTGLISGTTVGGMDRTEHFFEEFAMDNHRPDSHRPDSHRPDSHRPDSHRGHLRDIVDHTCGRTTERIAGLLGIRNFISTINTACSSSVNAIIYGSRLIRDGQLDVVVAGGTDALTRFTLNGFNSLMILDKELCRPFDATRAGLNLGEGAGFVVLVSEKVLKTEKSRPLCFVSGYANTNDAFHQTASSPEGRGSFAAMQQALTMSGLGVQDIDYINLHGTGTQNNDSSEGAAVKRLFGDHLPRLSSTKAYSGHTLGASGGIEAVYSVLAIEEGCVFPNLRFSKAMPENEIIPQSRFEKNLTVDHVLSNSFGFGGNCSSIILSKP